MSPTGDPRLWTPARYIMRDQRCHFCGADIPRTHPGATTGNRGTKAFVNIALGLFECMPCRLDATDAEMAPRVTSVERCEACQYERLSSHWPSDRPLFGLKPCDGCELGAGRGFDRHCPRCHHVEHRAHARPPVMEEVQCA